MHSEEWKVRRDAVNALTDAIEDLLQEFAKATPVTCAEVGAAFGTGQN